MSECCVCYSDNYVTKTECNHLICIGCLSKINKLECPLCRNKLKQIPNNFKDLREIKNNNENNPNLNNLSNNNSNINNDYDEWWNHIGLSRNDWLAWFE